MPLTRTRFVALVVGFVLAVVGLIAALPQEADAANCRAGGRYCGWIENDGKHWIYAYNTGVCNPNNSVRVNPGKAAPFQDDDAFMPRYNGSYSLTVAGGHRLNYKVRAWSCYKVSDGQIAEVRA